IDFTWSIRYAGRRRPLVILEPSLTNPIGANTCVKFYALPRGAKEGRSVALFAPNPGPILNPFNWGIPQEPRQWFLTVRRGQTATGTTGVPVPELKERLHGKYPAEFPAATPPQLYAQFVHDPMDRGARYDLDAWTGTLESPLLTVPEVKKW